MTFERQQTLIDHAMRARTEAVSAWLAALGRAVLQTGRDLYRAWQAARARSELHALSDRTLKDIGLGRSEIDSLFR